MSITQFITSFCFIVAIGFLMLAEEGRSMSGIHLAYWVVYGIVFVASIEYGVYLFSL